MAVILKIRYDVITPSVNSGAVDIIRTTYYIHGLELMTLIFAVCPFKGRNTKVCMWSEVPDVITRVKFNVNRFRGF